MDLIDDKSDTANHLCTVYTALANQNPELDEQTYREFMQFRDKYKALFSGMSDHQRVFLMAGLFRSNAGGANDNLYSAFVDSVEQNVDEERDYSSSNLRL